MVAPVKAMLAVVVMVSAGQACAQFDPTAPPPLPTLSTAANHSAGAQLTWVRVDGQQSVAWYGGTTVRLGETVNDGRLVAIHEDHIVIVDQQGRRVVYLLDPALRARQSKEPRSVHR